ncbi:sugar-binding domain-containing protein [Streptomyces rapamycinicus]|uniref:Glycoside hydrolase n=2 Tax=Streptomyces rapamycinicus TaxID=1226757 RepID=A0A0A0N3E2_STRRN|nr:sugar-binding domain-containing protein [Streptomyces rapamycinicus]AGP52057.1 glycoside hydrolase [Streptomyces rapamycinicus NRRL 5491]MBB4779490.1 beta-galactosidase/beta-glucuronidase [Streptomyces rapamycinicus]RLV75847.1 glycoside hydrolase [Streptomyces rapamycinicus NRRL 5491]UTP28260.1 glycoside hydrolase family 2 [Streptomyces rapamycinicus NRRL 5491]
MSYPHLDAAGHPRPQLVRDPDWRDLGGPWRFAHDDEDRGRADRWMDPAASAPFTGTVTVPYPPESAASGVADTGFHPVLWYRRTIDVPRPAAGRRLLLHFGAVDHRAEVWLNGRPVGRHEGGHTGFTCDLTDAVGRDGEQTIVVRAEDQPLDAAQPRGKQDWRRDPHVIWYHRTSGIWQPVWLEEVPAEHITLLHWTPEVVHARVRCRLRLARWPRRPRTVTVRLTRGERVLAEQRTLLESQETEFDVAVPALRHGQDLDDLLWSPERPQLVDAVVELRDAADDTPVDRAASYLGLRDIGWDDGLFLLNHKPYFLRFALQQGYWPASHLSASAGELRRDVELAKETGLNGLRVHQKIEDPRFLYWADRLGLLLWEEMPSAYAFGALTVERVVAEWTEAVSRDLSHPSIVAWVPINESWSVPNPALVPAQRHFMDALYHLTKALDPSRPAVSNDGWEISAADIWGVHDYTQHGDVLRERYGHASLRRGEIAEQWPGAKRLTLEGVRHQGQPVVLSEFGGATFEPAEGAEWFGYDTVATKEDFAERLAGLVAAAVDSGLAGFCYTQFTDTEQETNGLLTPDRRPKIPLTELREILTRTRV